jgi:inhibitor of KinA sporulation pathway (predicted exonuclease)
MQLVIFDTEFTAWLGSHQRKWSEEWEQRELIQLAAVKLALSGEGVEILSSFNEVVKPSINVQLSDYIIELTGISQSMVDNMGVDFASSLDLFHQFCQNGELPCYAWGHDEKILRENCQLNQIDMPHFGGGFFNLNKIARNANIDGAHLCSGDLANQLGLDLPGHVHNALYDVRSIALALNHWLTNGSFSVSLLKQASHIRE